MALTEKQKLILKEMVNFKCQLCKLKKPLEFHRIKRGNKGGEYTPNNILIICEECHKELHGDELK